MKNLLVAALIFCITSPLANKSFSADRAGMLSLFKVGDCVEYYKSEKTGKHDFSIYKPSPKGCVYSWEEARYDVAECVPCAISLLSCNLKMHKEGPGQKVTNATTGEDMTEDWHQPKNCQKPTWERFQRNKPQILEISSDYIKIKDRRNLVIPYSSIGTIEFIDWDPIECRPMFGHAYRNCK